MNSIFRKLSIVLGAIILLGSIFFLFPKLSKKEAPPKKEVVDTIIEREVKVMRVKNQDISSKLAIQGSLEAFNKVGIFAEVTGTLSTANRTVKVGNYFKKGTILLDIEREEAKLNIFSQKSNVLNAITTLMPDLKIDHPESFQQWKTYLDNFDVNQSIKDFPKPLNDQEKYFIASKNLLSQYYTIKSAENRLQKYTVYAPFSGVITQSTIQPGTLVRAGQQMAELMSTSAYEMKATLNLEDLKFIKAGSKVILNSDAVDGTWTGIVKRISDQIDPNTQSVIAYIGVTGQGLREGMYLRGNLNSNTIKSAVQLPIDLLVNQNKIYIVKDGKLALQTIELVTTNANFAVVKGLTDEQLILKEKIIGAYEGLTVKPIELTASVE